MSLATLGAGAQFMRGDGASPEVFTKIGEIIDLPQIGEAGNTVQVTNHDSPSIGGIIRHEYIGGIMDPSEVAFKANFINDATQDAINGFISASQAQAKENYRVITKSSVQMDFEAIARDWGGLPALESQEVLGGVIKITGAITVT